MSDDGIEEFAGALIEVPDDGSIMLVVLRAVVQEPVQYDGRDSTLAAALTGVKCQRR